MVRRVSRRTFLKVSGATVAVAATGALVGSMLIEGDDPEPPDPFDPFEGFNPQPGVTPSISPRVDDEVRGYMAVAPRVLRSGQLETVSLALFSGRQVARSTVVVDLIKDGNAVATSSAWVAGRGTVPLQLPDLAAGDYRLKVSARGFEETADIQVEDGTLVFLETDKPIYKPGQTVHIRVLTLDPTLRPVTGDVVVEVLDAQGIKVFRRDLQSDEYGMATFDLPLSTEPNLGVWSVLASTDRRTMQTDIRVERYVLPKYEVRIELEQDWALVNQPISGVIAAEYAFGKPVNGEVELVASRYVGVWEPYATVLQPISDGRLVFEIPAVEYVTGSPNGGGLGSVQIEVKVVEQATEYTESTTQLVSIAESPVALRIIPDSSTFKPGLPLSLLIVTETPEQQSVDAMVQLNLSWQDDDYEQTHSSSETVRTTNGIGSLTVTPPDDAVMLTLDGSVNSASWAYLNLRAGYSPSSTFIHVAQETSGTLTVGQTARFHVSATNEARSFFYEVLSRGKVIFSDVSETPDIEVTLTPLMAPEARLLVYQILPSGEVAADYVPFSVSGDYPLAVSIEPGAEQVEPGDELEINVQTDGPARVGLVAVDRSVFILAENRLNLQQVFAELERLSLLPQAELHEAEPGLEFQPMFDPWGPLTMPGADDTFRDAGVIVLTNQQVPEAKEVESPWMRAAAGAAENSDDDSAPAPPLMSTSADAVREEEEGTNMSSQAQPERIRQFFPETWIWSDLTTDDTGRAVHAATAPDSITTWMFRAVALSRELGLGIGEAELRVFQPFFVTVDLPFAAIRGEELPASIALYNYTQSAEEFTVELEPADWFEPLAGLTQTVTVGPNEVGAAAFPIRTMALGVHPLRVTARGTNVADAIIKEMIVEPEGVTREQVENLVLASGSERSVDLSLPDDTVDGSGRAFVALTGNVLSQTMDGLESLLQMSFGCGEQNMILFAPNVFITRYLNETGQLKPEVRARAETLMLTGYQREMTYRRSDGSFSAFGESDPSGSLWLTAFVLKTFAQAAELVYIDPSVLATGREWIRSHQASNGSFEPVGFVHHTELLGGLDGTPALTAFIAIALYEAGDTDGSTAASHYLEAALEGMTDDYPLALTTYALSLTGSGQAAQALDALMAIAKEDEDGLYWGDEITPLNTSSFDSYSSSPTSAAVETTAYAALALLAHDRDLDAGRAIRWLAAQRNSSGGFGSTQDTVVALQAMTTAASASRDDIDATVFLAAVDFTHEVQINAENADILQIVEVPVGATISIETTGTGQVMGQAVRRYNLPESDDIARPIFDLNVEYSTDEIEVDDTLDITATIRYTPPESLGAGMVVLDVSIPTGFAPVDATLDALIANDPLLKRWEPAGRKVIFYIDDIQPGQTLTLEFQARALYPVRAEPVASRVYAYYKPGWAGESLGRKVVVV